MKQAKMCALLIAMVALPKQSSATSVIDFEDWTGGAEVQAVVQSRGFSFHNGFVVCVEPQTGNATFALHGAKSAKFLSSSGASFSITSLDLQEGLGVTDTTSIQLIGYRASLPPVIQTFALDGHSDTFETFYPVGFSGLTDAYVYAYDVDGQHSQGFSVDNIVVPEPGTLGLLIFVLGLTGTRRSRRR